MKIKRMTKKDKIEAQLHILNKYFEFEDKVAIFNLEFDCFDDLLDHTFVGCKTGKMNHTLFDKIDEMFLLLPTETKAKIRIHFKDQSGYSKEEIKQIISDNLQLKIYGLAVETVKTSKSSWIFLGFGSLLLVLSYFVSKYIPQVLTDIVNISGTLMVWESVGDKIFSGSENTKYAKQYIVRILDLDIISNSLRKE
jgi:hypothetical protein